MRIIRDSYLTLRFFVAYCIVLVLFLIGYWVPVMLWVAPISLGVLVLSTVVDLAFLYHPSIRFISTRRMANVLSMGSDNTVTLQIKSTASIPLSTVIIDELPEQLENRTFSMEVDFSKQEKKEIKYTIFPTSRGLYSFGNTLIFLRSILGLAERKISCGDTSNVAVYPSLLLMKKFELKSFNALARFYGIKKLRKIGHSYEFEQIKNYVRGDDIRSINWKATGRKNELMVNQYEDEKSQQVYCIIDKSRAMRLPFGGLTLLDHSINTALVVSNTALQKEDKAGLLIYSNTINRLIKAEKGSRQLKTILDALYNESEYFLESNMEMLYQTIRSRITVRSLFFLFTNFESLQSLERVLPYLRRINKFHLLVVVFFENTEVLEFSLQAPSNTEEIYQQTVAKKLLLEKGRIVQELKKYGIQSIITKPEDLPLNTINKYLELKSRGMI
ncbi:MAG: DUF58 domain-containing protein [Cytophagaceae bacterium]